jgi:hypothetical protein
VPADVLAVELGARRNAVYKALFEARRKLRATLTADGCIPHTAAGTIMTGPRWLDEKAAKEKGRPVQATQRPSRKVELKQPKEKSKRIIQEEKRITHEELQRRLPGVDRLLAFFRAAGVRTELVSGGCLWIDGSQVELLRWILPSAKTLSWNDVIDEMALKYVRDKFVRAVEDNACFGEGLRVVLQWRERGFAIMHNDVRLGVIHATRVQIPRRPQPREQASQAPRSKRPSNGPGSC